MPSRVWLGWRIGRIVRSRALGRQRERVVRTPEATWDRGPVAQVIHRALIAGELLAVEVRNVTDQLAPGEVPVWERELTADEEVLAALGYKYVPPPVRSAGFRS